ncbi:MAG: SRPBCC family protein [Planctomycetales bacterium]|nr:SRPBCC family protein [Planctomycetales bacterium]
MFSVRTHSLRRQIVLSRPIDEVFAFFSDAMNLERITPASVGFRILTPPPIIMQAGTLIDYRIRLFGIPMKWRTLIETYEPPTRFVDTQVVGPYAKWIHTHSFRSVDGGTEITDNVDYQIPWGPVGEFAKFLFVSRTLKHIFDYRGKQIIKIFGSS